MTFELVSNQEDLSRRFMQSYSHHFFYNIALSKANKAVELPNIATASSNQAVDVTRDGWWDLIKHLYLVLSGKPGLPALETFTITKWWLYWTPHGVLPGIRSTIQRAFKGEIRICKLLRSRALLPSVLDTHYSQKLLVSYYIDELNKDSGSDILLAASNLGRSRMLTSKYILRPGMVSLQCFCLIPSLLGPRNSHGPSSSDESFDNRQVHPQ